jgi:hypothetical protein
MSHEGETGEEYVQKARENAYRSAANEYNNIDSEQVDA